MKFSRISFHHLDALILDRINSAVSLVGEVFLKTVRRLVYGRLYDSERHRFRRVSNLIRELTRHDFELKQKRNVDDPEYFQNISGCPDFLKGNYDVVIGKKLAEVAETAASFGTNLWFTETNRIEQVLQNLIVCGQATMCFNMLKYLVELQYTPDNGYVALPAETRSEIERLWQHCKSDWQMFKADPFFMVGQH